LELAIKHPQEGVHV